MDTEINLVVARRDKNGRISEIGEGDSEVQTSSYKPLWVCSHCLLFFLDFDHVVLSPQVFLDFPT